MYLIKFSKSNRTSFN